jgi:hypothetical protein
MTNKMLTKQMKRNERHSQSSHSNIKFQTIIINSKTLSTAATLIEHNLNEI